MVMAMHQRWPRFYEGLRSFAVGVAAALPVWVWFADTVGYVGEVSGNSMWVRRGCVWQWEGEN